MTPTHLISVIVPIYNVENQIVDCLSSIVNQTYQNLEIILVNDGSTDNSMIQADFFVQSDKRIKVIEQSNQGLSQARNVGIDNANGEYIIFVDSDDKLTENAVEVLYQAIMQYNVPIAIGSVVKEQLNRVTDRIIFNEEVLDVEGLVYANGNSKQTTMKIVAWGKLYHKSLFDDIRYPIGKLHEDEFTTYKLYLKSQCAVTIPHIVYHYVFRTDSIMATKVSVKNTVALDAFVEKCDVLKSHGLSSNQTNLAYRYRVEKFWFDGHELNDKALCKIARQRYWYGFKNLPRWRKKATLLKYVIFRICDVLPLIWRNRVYMYLRMRQASKQNELFSKPFIFYSESTNLAYRNNFKVASSSILNVLLEKEFGLTDTQNEFDLAVSLLKNPLKNISEYKQFTFVANPFKRLVSCYQNKVVEERELKDRTFDYYLFGSLKKSKSFDEFVKKVVKIKPNLLEGHIALQYDLLYVDDVCQVDFIGKLENIKSDFKILQNEYDLPDLPRKNKTNSGDYRDYYTLEIAQLVYNFYLKDIETFGYEEEYQQLLNYLKEKDK